MSGGCCHSIREYLCSPPARKSITIQVLPDESDDDGVPLANTLCTLGTFQAPSYLCAEYDLGAIGGSAEESRSEKESTSAATQGPGRFQERLFPSNLRAHQKSGS
jgi:hypothetical protein